MNDTLSREATLPFSILPVFPKGVSWVMGGGGGGGGVNSFRKEFAPLGANSSH